uniref:eIF3e-related protein n=1 Tax=Asparagus officinalis TaxID=4686 RepID=Q2XNU9_ASPOF|nr:eIF3e-related protein [Asparagus officinalis]
MNAWSAKIDLKSKTNMVDYAMAIHKNLYHTEEVPQGQIRNPSERSLSVHWGKLTAEILMQNWDEALEELNRLKEIIDSKVTDPVDRVHCRRLRRSFRSGRSTGVVAAVDRYRAQDPEFCSAGVCYKYPNVSRVCRTSKRELFGC